MKTASNIRFRHKCLLGIAAVLATCLAGSVQAQSVPTQLATEIDAAKGLLVYNVGCYKIYKGTNVQGPVLS